MTTPQLHVARYFHASNSARLGCKKSASSRTAGTCFTNKSGSASESRISWRPPRTRKFGFLARRAYSAARSSRRSTRDARRRAARRWAMRTVGAHGLHLDRPEGFKPSFSRVLRLRNRGQWACGSVERTAQRPVIADVAADHRFAGTAAAAVIESARARAVTIHRFVSVSGCVLGVPSTHYPTLACRWRPTSRSSTDRAAHGVLARAGDRLIA